RPDLAGYLAGDVDEDEPLRPGQLHAHPEALVGLLMDDMVVGGRLADRVAPDPVWPPGLVDGQVEQRRAVGRPGRAVERVADLIPQYFTGSEVFRPEGESFVAGEVGGVGQPAAVWAYVVGAEREELRVAGQRVAVDQYLFAGEWTAVAAY